jgi:hypothetical protein
MTGMNPNYDSMSLVRFLGYKQRFRHAVNDRLGIGPDSAIQPLMLAGPIRLSDLHGHKNGEKANPADP